MFKLVIGVIVIIAFVFLAGSWASNTFVIAPRLAPGVYGFNRHAENLPSEFAFARGNAARISWKYQPQPSFRPFAFVDRFEARLGDGVTIWVKAGYEDAFVRKRLFGPIVYADFSPGRGGQYIHNAATTYFLGIEKGKVVQIWSHRELSSKNSGRFVLEDTPYAPEIKDLFFAVCKQTKQATFRTTYREWCD